MSGSFGCSVATGRRRPAHEFADRDDALHGARTLPDRGVSLSKVPVRVSDRYPELLVGARALQHFVVMIDQRSNSAAVCN